MKAYKAPEKIYISPNTEESTYYVSNQYKRLIEYTRTDAFIEKAEDYLNSQLYDWVSITNPDQRSYANTISKKDFIEGFRKYIKK